MAKLEVRGLTKSLTAGEVLHDVSFEVASGDIVSVIGPSGGGKTTLFRCITGELRPGGGRVFLDDEDVTDWPIERRGCAVVPQNYALFPHMTVAENTAYGLRAQHESPKDVEARVGEMLGLVGLSSKADRYPVGLSGGERQRVALARALAIKPRLLLLDEAFAALDATTRGEVVQEVRGIVRRLGVTTVLITHDQEEAFLFARNVIVLNDGRIVTQGPSEEVMGHDDPFIRSFVRMVHLSKAKVEQDGGGHFVEVAEGARLPINLPNIKTGDLVHVLVKKSGASEVFEVWPDDR